MTRHSPPPKIAWLGDDFTGAAAVMEVLTFSGVPSVLFLGRPTPAQMAASLSGIEAFGIATLARSHSPEWMDTHLPDLFGFLDDSGAELVHYKICSTLDSSPQIGSIGRAIDLGLQCFGAAAVPVVVAAPPIRRHQVYGNLFCGYSDEVFRLDRHPVMARHPVTPMQEADIALHLAQQTDVPTRCMDLDTLADVPRALDFLKSVSGASICTIDCLDGGHEKTIGRLLWDRRDHSRFVVGSQGVEYALIAHFVATGMVADTSPPPGLGYDQRMVVVSGSVSSITADQISWARNNGFAAIQVDALDLCGTAPLRTTAMDTAIRAAHQALADGLCPLIFTAEGPDDPAVAKLRAQVQNPDAANAAIGKALGQILKTLIKTCDLRRVAVSGGDTSGHVCAALGIFALEAAAPTIPGAAICRARSDTALDGLEIALKGGQMGSQDYFGWVRDGGGAR